LPFILWQFDLHTHADKNINLGDLHRAVVVPKSFPFSLSVETQIRGRGYIHVDFLKGVAAPERRACFLADVFAVGDADAAEAAAELRKCLSRLAMQLCRSE